MQRYKITIAYDGTRYAGWQVQPNAVTVQETLETALRDLTGEAARVHGSGRTDQGVHARGQAAHFDLENKTAAAGLRRGLNALLPGDIRIRKAETVPPSFHARRSARGKEYRYFIWNAEIVPPFLRLYRLHVRKKLDVSAMRAAARPLVGRHDFRSFAANPNRAVATHVRRVSRLEVRKRGAEIVVIAAGEGFLYRMVRSFAGWLIRVGEGAVASSEAAGVLAAGVRTARVPTAPAQGLFLWRVEY